MTAPTLELLRDQMALIHAQIALIESHIHLPSHAAITIPVLNRVQDQYRDLASTIRTAILLLE
jgi:hypothetical protein